MSDQENLPIPHASESGTIRYKTSEREQEQWQPVEQLLPIDNRRAAPGNSSTFIAGIILLIVAGALFALLYLLRSNVQLAAVVAVLLGFVSVSAGGILRRAGDERQSGASYSDETLTPVITFAEHDMTARLSGLVGKMPSGMTPQTKQVPWDINPFDVAGVDNAFALAKVRLDIERELKRIQEESLPENVRFPNHIASARHMVTELTRRGVLPDIVEEPLQQVLDACNKAIHGGEVSTETTLSIIRVGLYILDILHSLPATSLQEPTQSAVN